MNLIKKYFLKKKLKKAIDLISTSKGIIDGTHYMCFALHHVKINKNTLPRFNFESFKEFIEIHYPELIFYLNKSYMAPIIPYSFPWMEEDDAEYYPDEEITQAKKHFLTYIMNNL